MAAELFVVPPHAVEQEPESESPDPYLFEVTGDQKTDLETALRCVAFLLDFVSVAGGPDGLRAIADTISKLEVQP